MPKWLKVVLALFAVLMVLCAVSAFAAKWWFDHNKDRLKSLGDTAAKDGATWAMTHDANGCVDEALHRYDLEGGIVAEAGHTLFMRACLDKAQRPQGFCDAVPPRNELLKTAEWSVTRCRALGRQGDQACTRMVKAIQESCAKKP